MTTNFRDESCGDPDPACVYVGPADPGVHDERCTVFVGEACDCAAEVTR